jgi:hypothetical protein
MEYPFLLSPFLDVMDLVRKMITMVVLVCSGIGLYYPKLVMTCTLIVLFRMIFTRLL